MFGRKIQLFITSTFHPNRTRIDLRRGAILFARRFLLNFFYRQRQKEISTISIKKKQLKKNRNDNLFFCSLKKKGRGTPFGVQFFKLFFIKMCITHGDANHDKIYLFFFFQFRFICRFFLYLTPDIVTCARFPTNRQKGTKASKQAKRKTALMQLKEACHMFVQKIVIPFNMQFQCHIF